MKTKIDINCQSSIKNGSIIPKKTPQITKFLCAFWNNACDMRITPIKCKTPSIKLRCATVVTIPNMRLMKRKTKKISAKISQIRSSVVASAIISLEDNVLEIADLIKSGRFGDKFELEKRAE